MITKKPNLAMNTTADLHAIKDQLPVEVPFQVDMRWYKSDPLALTLAFRAGRDGWVTWVAAVELLRDALACSQPVGEGDIRLQQLDDDTMHIELASPTGKAVFSFLIYDLTAFLERIDREHAPWEPLDQQRLDAELHRLLATGGDLS